MTIPVSNTSEYKVPYEVQSTALRRKWLPILSELKLILDNPRFDDKTSGLLRGWLSSFNKHFNSICDENEVLKHHLELLDEILRDPISHLPLDEEALLGTDGRTYDRRSLAVFLSDAPKYHDRTPCDIHKAGFSTTPHPVISHFLKLFPPDTRIRSSEIDQVYERLIESGKTPKIPSDRSIKIARLKEREQQRQQRLLESLGTLSSDLESVKKEAFETIHYKFNAIEASIEARAAENMKRIQLIPEQDSMEKLKLEALLNKFNEGIEDLKRRNSALKEELSQVHGKIAEVERANRELQLSIQEYREEIKRAQSESFSGILMAIGIIGGCYLASLALSGMFAASSSVSVFSTSHASFGINVGCAL